MQTNSNMQTNTEPLPSRAGMPPVPPATSPELERLARDFRAFMNDCEALFKNAQTLGSEGAAVARAEFGRRIADARVKLDDLRSTAGDRAVQARNVTEDYVRREPLKTMLAAVAAGAIIALLVNRR